MDHAAPDAVAMNRVAMAVQVLRGAEIRNLESPGWLEHVLLPGLGLSDVMPEFYPPHLRGACGMGVLSFQQPNQFARYLVHMSRRKVGSYLEVGAWHGGTFIITVEYLSRFHPITRATAIDVTLQPGLRSYAELNPAVSLIGLESQSPLVRPVLETGWWDLAMIDGDHSEEGCLADYMLVRDSARMVALHDTASELVPGVASAWRRLTAVLPRRCVTEFTEQYPEVLRETGKRVMGIGVIEVGDPVP